MAIRDDFTAGEVLAAADLNDTFAAKLNLAGGKVLQVVRATDVTQRATTSTTFVDVTGMSITITPQKNTSAILIIAAFVANCGSGAFASDAVDFQVTDSSNNAMSGAQSSRLQNVSAPDGGAGHGLQAAQTLVAYDTPATLSAVTYKLRFKVGNASTTGQCQNATQTGQLFAIEVSA